MHVHSLFAAAFMLTGASAAEPQIFHEASFSDATIVDLAMSHSPSASAGYDFEVLITVTERFPSGKIKYRDTSRHAAKIRCDLPMNVLIGGIVYPIVAAPISNTARDWKRDLWLALCGQSLS